MSSQNVQVLTYQIQYINIEVRNTDISFIMNSIKKSKNRAQKRKHHATIFGTPGHGNLKAKQREKYASIFGTPAHENRKAQQREKKRKMYASLFGTPEHENIKRTMRYRYTAISRTQILKCFGWKLQKVHILFVLFVTEAFIGSRYLPLMKPNTMLLFLL